MRVAEARGAKEVVGLLRNLADEIERKNLELEGRHVGLSDSLEAAVEISEGATHDVSLIDIRLEHPEPAVWDATQLRQAMAYPGD